MVRYFSRVGWGTGAIALVGFGLVSLLGGCASAATPGADGPTASSSIPTNRVIGTWGESSPRQPHLTFDDASGVVGTDGCNSISSHYEQKGDTVTFTETTSTLMACIGVDSWLSGLSTATVDGDQLLVKNEKGDTIGVLAKAS